MKIVSWVGTSGRSRGRAKGAFAPAPHAPPKIKPWIGTVFA